MAKNEPTRLLNKFTDNEKPILDKNIFGYYKLKSKLNTFENLNDDKLLKQIADEYTAKLIKFIDLNGNLGYKNSGEKILGAKFKHPDKCKDEGKTYFDLGKKIKEPINKYKTPRDEDILERLIKVAFDEKNLGYCENQFPIPECSGGTHVDLMIRNNKEINFIELKEWDNENDTPVWAVAEIIKNLYLFLHFNRHLYSNYKFDKSFDLEKYRKSHNIKGIKKFILTVLAPKKYYDFYLDSENKIKNYKKLCNYLNENIKEDLKLDIKIELKLLNFEQNKFETLIKKIQHNYLYERKGKSFIKGEREYAGPIELEEYISKKDKYNILKDLNYKYDDIIKCLSEWENF